MRWSPLRSVRTTRVTVFDMMLKIVALFLVFIAILGMFGKLRFPGQKRLAEAKCPKCGRYRIGKGPCSCGRLPKK